MASRTPIHKQLNALQQVKTHLQVKEQILLEKAVMSNNPSDIIAASKMTSNNIEARQENERKAYVVDPLQFNQFLGYKNKPYSLSYSMLKRISYAVPIIRAIINTRLDQIASFCEPQRDKYSTGFVIRKKRGWYDKGDKEPTKAELQRAEFLTEFVLNCGSGNEFDADDFDTFTRKVFNDSYMYDAKAWEIVRNKKGVPMNYYATDASTIRIADSFDSDQYTQDYVNRTSAREKVKGYYPAYSQLFNGQIHTDFYPWEMCYAIRNPVTDIFANGYGVSEIEILINVITSMLWGDEYNRRFFSQGSAPKGFLKIKTGSLIGNGKLGDFKQAWQSMMSGVTNSHKTPILEGDVDWVDLQHTNRDMEFSNWQEYLIKLACAIYRIDPAEINFPLSGGAEQRAMFEGNNEARLKHSKDKGLYPSLKMYQRKLNKFLIGPLDPSYELVFVGMDGIEIGEELDQDIKMVGNFMTVDEVRMRRGLKPLGAENGGNLILNATWMQNKNAQMMQEQQQQQMEQGGNQQGNPQMKGNPEGDDAYIDEEEDGFNSIDTDAQEKEEDPFEKAFTSFMETLK